MKYTVMLGFVVAACGTQRVAGAPFQDYGAGKVVVIGTDASGGTVAVGSFTNGCASVTDSLCVAASRTGPYCSGASTGPVDVVAVDGKAVATVCYPSPDASKRPVVVSDSATTLSVAKTANGSAITFTTASDGKPIVGDVHLDANDVSLYGNGPDKTIIDGDLIVAGNNAHIRGVRVKGNLVLNTNNDAVVLVVVVGNIEGEKNNLLIASSTIKGNVHLSGNDIGFYYNSVLGNVEMSGNGGLVEHNHVHGGLDVSAAATCTDNVKWTDGNADQAFQAGEAGEALKCK